MAENHVILPEKLEELQELSGGNNELLVDLLDKYLSNTPELIEQARTALKEGNTEKVDYAVHTMKGSSLSLGLTPLGELLTEMNVRTKKGELDDMSGDIDKVEGYLKDVKTYFESIK